VWGAVVDGRTLTFRLAGINNENFVMQDVETGTWWQQVSGEAFLGPLKGRRLQLVAYDLLQFDTWKTEAPAGRVLEPDERIVRSGGYAPVDWEFRLSRLQRPPGSAQDPRMDARALVVGIAVGSEAKAFPVTAIEAAGVVLDEIGGVPVAIVRAEDGRSTRVFDRRAGGRTFDLVKKLDRVPLRLVDVVTGSEWDFTGLAVSGPAAGTRLSRLPFLEEFWFDWRTYHPSTTLASPRS
jgi:hypothetical protein